jgi:hypothetical protein
VQVACKDTAWPSGKVNVNTVPEPGPGFVAGMAGAPGCVAGLPREQARTASARITHVNAMYERDGFDMVSPPQLIKMVLQSLQNNPEQIKIIMNSTTLLYSETVKTVFSFLFFLLPEYLKLIIDIERLNSTSRSTILSKSVLYSCRSEKSVIFGKLFWLL